MKKSKETTAAKATVAERSVEDTVKVDPLTLDDEFARIASDLAYWSARFAAVLKRHLVSKARRKRIHAELYLEIKNTPPDDGKRVTEDGVKAQIEVHERYQEAVENEIDAEVERERLYGVTEALRAKKDALISLGANRRAEMDGNPRIRSEHRGARDVEATRRDADDEIEIEDDD